MSRLLLLVSWLITGSLAAMSQQDNYRAVQYTTENGMPSNGIKGLQWDEKTGFLWIATEAGLVRFNGLEFTNFTKENTPGIEHERMAYLIKNDNASSIYVSDYLGNICKVVTNHPSSFSNFKNKGAFGNRYILSVTNEFIQRKILEFTSRTRSSEVLVISITPRDDGSCAIVTALRRFFLLSPGGKEFTELPIQKKFDNIFKIGNKRFLVDTTWRFYSPNASFTEFNTIPVLLPNGNPVDFNLGTNLLIWENGMERPILFTRDKAWILSDKVDHLEAELVSADVPSYSQIRFAQYSEKTKTLFIGTDSKGIIVIKKNQVSPVKNKNPNIQERNSYYGQIELSDQMILTSEGHVIGIDSNKTSSLPIAGKFSYSNYVSGDSLIWYGQFNAKLGHSCLNNYNLRTRQTAVFEKIPIWETFGFIQKSDRIYIGTQEGLGVLEGDSVHYQFANTTEQSTDANPIAMVEVSPNVIIAASCSGLMKYDLNKKSQSILLDLPGYCIRTLWPYKDYLFIGTYGKGFFIYKNGQIKQMPLDKNNYLLYTHCFVPDDNGFIWISTNRGLFKAQLSDIVNAYDNDITSVYYYYLGKNDGMDITEMNGGCWPCALVMKNKTISFPTMDGLVWVEPGASHPQLPEGDIYVDLFQAGNRLINTDSISQTTLLSRERDIDIKLSFAGWSNKENIYLDYKLNNSKVWIPIDVSNDAEIKLNNLSPGTYTVHIRKLNGFGANNYSYKAITFTINTPWYQQWWFYMLMALATLSLIGLYLRFRTQQYIIRQRKLEKQVEEKTKELTEQNAQLEKNDSIKTRLISIISHDIITPLKFLTVAGKNLLDKRKKMDEQLQDETIREMTNTSQELQMLSTNILNWIKYQNENRRMMKETFNIHGMVNQVLGLLQSLARQKKLTIENQIDEQLTIYQYYEPLKILVYNLLTNAIHFTEKGKIIVGADVDNDSITVFVKDEGIGMSNEQVQRLLAAEVVITSVNVDNKKGHGLGFLIIKDLVKTMGAYLDIESTKGVGTTVSVIIPKENRQ